MFLRVFNQPIPSFQPSFSTLGTYLTYPIHLKICDPKSEIIPQRSSNLKSKNLQISKSSPHFPFFLLLISSLIARYDL